MKRVSAIVLILLTMFSCQKQNEIPVPVIEILSPANNQGFTVGDTILFQSNITAFSEIESIRTGLVDQVLAPVFPAKVFYPGASEASVFHEIPVDDPYMETGNYRLQIVVAYEGRLKHNYREIKIKGIDKTLDKVIVLENAGPQQTRIHILRPDLSFDSAFISPHSYLNSGSVARHSMLYYLKQEPTVLYAFSDKKFDLEWAMEVALPFPVATDVYAGDLFYVSSGNGDIWGYDASGFNEFQTERIQNHTCEDFSVNEVYIAAEFVSYSGAQRFIAVFYRATAAEKNRRITYFDIREFVPLESGFLIFRDSPGGFSIMLLEPEEMVLTELLQITGRDFKDVVRVSDETIIVSDDAGLWEYNVPLNRLTRVSDIASGQLRYDEVRNLLINYRGKSMMVLERNGYDLIWDIDFEQDIHAVELIYNK